MSDEYDRMADFREVMDLRERARRARYVAQQINDIEAARGLKRYSEELESRADALEAKHAMRRAADEGRDRSTATAVKPETPQEPVTVLPAKSDTSQESESA